MAVILNGWPGLALGAAILLSSAAAHAAGPPPPAPVSGGPSGSAVGVPICVEPPPSGKKLAGDMELAAEGHVMEFTNSGGGDALIKIRHADSGRLAASFFLRRGETLTIEGVPDGSYVVQYAFGPALAPDCRSLTRIVKASQMPETDVLTTQVHDDDDHSEITRMSVAYDLSVGETANQKPISIDAAAFDAD
jgi:hypothetical protein